MNIRKYYYDNSHYCDPQLYRVHRGFTYSGQPKKEKDMNKGDWWETKGFIRDRRKSHKRMMGLKTELKHDSNHKSRPHVRDAIRLEKYDNIHAKTHKDAVSYWNYY